LSNFDRISAALKYCFDLSHKLPARTILPKTLRSARNNFRNNINKDFYCEPTLLKMFQPMGSKIV